MHARVRLSLSPSWAARGLARMTSPAGAIRQPHYTTRGSTLQAALPRGILAPWPRFARPLCTSPPETPPRPFEGAVLEGSPGSFMMMDSPLQARFVNMIMKNGKKQVARRILWDAMSMIRDAGHDPQAVFLVALENVRPMMEMRSMRSGQVPFPLNPKRAEGQAMKWLVDAARKRQARGGMADGLSQELLQAYQGKGAAAARREAVHKAAVANQAAAHFRWRNTSTKDPNAIDMDKETYRPKGRRAIRRLQ
mmetsp:Transcript_4200/g.9000  ORF Transcript_4200/g.9000 Transcript_4200/m.9000 type:complete len:251 (+) Transcript_4200:17-769(+)